MRAVVLVEANRSLAVSASGRRPSRGREQGQVRVRAAPRTVLGSYYRYYIRGRRLIVLALQATMDLDVLEELKE